MEDLKTIIGKLSKLRSEMQTNKSLQLTTAPSILEENLLIWDGFSNAVANLFTSKSNSDHKWFETPWLFVECYMYRLIQGTIEER